jgi:dienelactone hydrolase
MKTEPLEYRHGDVVLRGELAYDDERQGSRPGILVVHEGSGLNDHARRRARQLAELGYVALACDMYGEGRVAKDRAEMLQLMGGLRADPPKLRGRARAALEALRAQPLVDRAGGAGGAGGDKIAAIGFCFGGLTVLELARDGADVAGVVSFHGSLRTDRPAERGRVRGKVLVCHGVRDPVVPPAELTAFIDEQEQAGVDCQVLTHGGAGHGFMNRNAGDFGVAGVAYDEKAERRSWAAMRSFFAEIFGPV